MPSSREMSPLQESFGTMFLKSQWLTKGQPPPADLNLKGQTGIITGGNCGLGLETAKLLLHHKISRLILTVRSAKKGEEATRILKAAHPSATVEIWSLDLGSYDSIQDFADRCSSLDRIDFVILNAALVNSGFQVSQSTGHEEVFQVDYLSNSLLAILLLPVLKSKRPPNKPSHLTFVSSTLTYQAKFPEQKSEPIIPAFDIPESYSQDRYATAKLLGLFFIAKLQDFVSADDVIINLADPGFIRDNSNLLRDSKGIAKVATTAMRYALGRSVQVGAWVYVYCAVLAGKESHCSYVFNWKIIPFPKILYTQGGKQVSDRLWEETLNELEFADVRRILNDVRENR